MLSLLAGFYAVGPIVDQAVTSEMHVRYEVATVLLDQDNYYILAYRNLSDGSWEILIVQMSKSDSCIRPAVGEWPHFDIIDVYKFNLFVKEYGCLYL